MIRPTRRGIGLGLILLSLYFFAGQTQIGWLYVMVSGGLAWLVISVGLPIWAISVIRIHREIVTPRGGPAVEGEPVTVRLTVSHGGRTTRRFVRLIEDCPLAAPGNRTAGFALDRIPAGRSTTVAYDVDCYLRGLYEWPPIRVASAGPLGLWRLDRWIDVPTEIVVLPPALSAEAAIAGARAEPAPAIRPRRGPGLDLFGTRPYTRGDALHHIHWRSTARHRELIVREFEEPRQPAIAIWIDNSGTFGEGRESTIEYAVKIATAIGTWALRSGYALIVIDREGTAPRTTPIHLRQALARLTIAETDDWPVPAELRRISAAVVLRAIGQPGRPPDLPPTAPAQAIVGLAGFPDQPADPDHPVTLTVRPGADLGRVAGDVVRRLAGASAALPRGGR